MSEILNPYIAGAPVTDARMFFGREDIFEWIERNLAGQYADHILVIHGQRRVGKTSVLKQLPHRLPQRYIPVFFDLQGRTRTSLDRFLWWLAREIVRVLKQDHGVTIPLPEKEDFSRDPEFLESRFLPSVQDPLKGRRLLLTFDEFDTLEEEEIRETLGRPLVDYLRRLMGREGLNFIFSIGSSGRKLENMQASYTEFFKTALYKKVSFLSREQAHHLITSPVEGILRYERDAVDRIVEITSGHPYFTQLTCHELFALSQRSGSPVIRKQDLEAVLDEVVERGTVNLKFVWDEASDLEKWVLAGMAHAEGKLDSRSLADFLKKQRVRFSPPDLEGALLHLREKDVLTESHAFVIYLMKLWLVKNRPLQQVREELTEVNPIANRYIEIGHEYQESGQYGKALESYREALGVDADNILAQVSIANVYLQQKAYAEAVTEFERALALDEEDVAARAGLCQTHLLLGDQAVAAGKLKEAIRSYQKVLAINAEHTEARQRMADIQRQQAERALSDGRDEEALAAFKEALGYTPEDQALEARYAEVLEERKARILAGLLVRAEKEAGGKQWDRAAATVRSGLELAPKDERFARVLQRVQQAQREDRIAGLRSRAAQAARQERWEDAIAALEDALRIGSGLKELEVQLAETRRQQRESRIGALRTRAQTATRAEKFDEALAAWNELLAVLPEEESSVRIEMQRVEKRQAWAGAYSQAQTAMAKRNYDRAISLLKGIVVEDETYKEASRLMAEAIEQRRAALPIWRRKWLTLGTGGVALVTVVLFLVWLAPSALQLLGKPTDTPPPTSELSAGPLAAPMGTATIKPTPVPTVLPTTVPLAWTRLSSGQAFLRDTITAIAIDPNDPGVIYVGTENAGIFKSIDGGVSWQPIHNGLGRAWIHSLVIDPGDPRILYAGVSTGGVYRTTNGGETWQEANTGIEDFGWEHAAEVPMDPQDSQHLIYTGESNGIYETRNGGETWSRINDTYPAVCFVDIRFHPIDSQTLFAMGHYRFERQDPCQVGVYRSRDGGLTWDGIGLQGMEIDADSHQFLVVDHQSGNMLYAATAEGLYGSRDGGENWQLLSDQACRGLGIAAENGNTVYCMALNGLLLTTTDGGITWTKQKLEFHRNPNVIEPSSHDANALVFGGSGVYVSYDSGLTWSERSSGLGAGPLELQFDPTDITHVYLQERQVSGMYVSNNEGKDWALVSDIGKDLAFDAAGGVMYRYDGSQLLRSQDGGQSWESLGLPLDATPGAIAAHPSQSQTLYVVYGRESPPYVFYSKDGGNSWVPALGMESIADGRFYFDHADGEVIYVLGDVDGFRSEDFGETWHRCGRTGEWHSRSHSRLAVDPRDPNRLILATRGGGILVSQDGCNTWHYSNIGLGNPFVNTVALDLQRPDTIFAGTDGGAYVSFDGGESWGEINDGLLGATVVYSIVVDPQSNVYAATPYGVFKLESR